MLVKVLCEVEIVVEHLGELVLGQARELDVVRVGHARRARQRRVQEGHLAKELPGCEAIDDGTLADSCLQVALLDAHAAGDDAEDTILLQAISHDLRRAGSAGGSVRPTQPRAFKVDYARAAERVPQPPWHT